MLGIDRFVGSFLGLCLGDALGAPVEAASPDVARRYVQQELRTGKAGQRGRAGFPFGQVTDDSQLSRELLISIAERRTADPAHFASRLSVLVAMNRVIGAGPGTIATGSRLRQGMPWDQAGEPAPYCGNGAAMRVAPLGVLWAQDPHRLIRSVVAQARVTHHDYRCAAGAVAIAAGSMVACRSTRLNPAEMCAHIARLAGQVDGGIADAIGNVEDLLTIEPEQAMAKIYCKPPEADSPPAWRGISNEVTGSVCWSLYAFLRSPDDYWETICTAISAGGDTDTTAAMAGGMVGARVGVKGLPQELLDELNDQGEWKVAELTSLAQRCYEACR
jgi:poly(ADP-ribose) glycohydrolase ARH3